MQVKNTPALTRLFKLIDSLNAIQKRAFKRDAKYWSDAASDRNYVQLFDKINKFCSEHGKEDNVTTYLVFQRINKQDYAKIKSAEDLKAYKKQVQDIKTELSVTAGYVFNKILASMRFMPDSSEGFVQLNSLMQDIYFLMNKSLYADCLYVIKIAIDLARKIDRPAYILELSLLERRVRSRMPAYDNHEDYIREISQQETRALKQMDLTNETQALTGEVRKHISARTVLPGSTESRIEDLIRLYSGAKLHDLTPRTRFQFLFLSSNFYSYGHQIKEGADTVKGDYLRKGLEIQELIIQLFDEHTVLKEEEAATYFNMLDSYLLKSLQLKKFDLVQSKIDELEQADDPLVRYRSGAFIRIQLFTGKGNYEAARKYIESTNLIEKWPELRDQFWPSRLISGYFLGMVTYFLLRKYEKGKLWSLLIIDETADNKMPHIRLIAQAIHIICREQCDDLEDPVPLLMLLRKPYEQSDSKYNQFAAQVLSLLTDIVDISKPYQKTELNHQLTALEQDIAANPGYQLFSFLLAWMAAEVRSDTTPTKEMAKFDTQN